MTYEQLARRFYAAIKVAAVACIAVRLMGCDDTSGREAAHRLEVESGFKWKGCKTLTAKYTSGSVCVSDDGLTLAICDEDGCIVFSPTAALERM
jgi:hypothetical protein